MILGLLTTPANGNEIANLEQVHETADLPKNINLYSEKGYQSAKNEDLLKTKKQNFKKNEKEQTTNRKRKKI